MRIVTVINSTAPDNGATKSWLMLVEGLRSKNVDVIVIAPDNNGVCDELRNMGCDVFSVDFRGAMYPYARCFREYVLFLPRLAYRLLLNWKAKRIILKYLTNKSVDLIHTNVSVLDVGMKVAKSLNVPHVFHFREYTDSYYHLKHIPSDHCFFDTLRKQYSYVICITKDIMNHYTKLEPKRTTVIYDAVFDELPIVNKNDNAPFFLYVGRLEQGKGLMQLLQAYKHYLETVKSPVPLHVIGDDQSDLNFTESVNTFIRVNKMENYVSFLGKRNDVLQQMTNAKVVIVPSVFEGFGRVLPEAMSVGTLTLGYNSTGTKEQYDNGFQMWNADIGIRYNTLEELTAALIDITENGVGKYVDMVDKAQQTVASLYGRVTHVENVFSFFSQIIDSVDPS